MNKEEYKLEISVYESIDELNQDDAHLLREARKITQNAYAPYSHFNVGAYARLENGEMMGGTNQENASYPAGMCAERTLLSAAGTLFPGVAIETMAITYENKNGSSNSPASPCGICRQVIAEFQTRVGKPMRLILSGMEGKVQVIENAIQLLPLVFTAEDMK